MATLIIHRREQIDKESFVEIKIWSVPESHDKPHGLKYSLAFVKNNQCLIRFDNSEQKGDHIHKHEKEYTYNFLSMDKLIDDFYGQIEEFIK